jgi:hypothetical protein
MRFDFRSDRTGGRLDRRWLALLYPELKHLPADRWSEALGLARQIELAPSERIGVLAAVGVCAYLLQPLGDSAAGFFTRYLMQFLLAIPLLAALVSPWLLRRTRRGLQHEARRLYGGESCPGMPTTPRFERGALSTARDRDRRNDP